MRCATSGYNLANTHTTILKLQMSQFNFAEAFLLILIAGSIFAENLTSSLFFGLVWYNVTQNSKQEQNNNAIRSLSEDFANKINELNEKIILIHDEVQTIREGDRFSNTSSFSHGECLSFHLRYFNRRRSHIPLMYGTKRHLYIQHRRIDRFRAQSLNPCYGISRECLKSIWYE